MRNIRQLLKRMFVMRGGHTIKMNKLILMIATIAILAISVYSSTSLYAADAMPVWRPGGDGIIVCFIELFPV